MLLKFGSLVIVYVEIPWVVHKLYTCELCVVFVHYLGNCLEMNSISQSLETFVHLVHFTRSVGAVNEVKKVTKFVYYLALTREDPMLCR